MTTHRDLALIEELLQHRNETEWLEFKHHYADPKGIAQYCSALSNAARLVGQETAYLLWGVDDASRTVVGTHFDPFNLKVGAELFELWLAKRLQPSLAFRFRQIDHPLGKLILLEIPAATTMPASCDAVAYIRIGSATPKLADYPERYGQLMQAMQPYRWETGVAADYLTATQVLSRLDHRTYFRLTHQSEPSTAEGILEKLAAERLVSTDVGSRWRITNLGALLFAYTLADFDPGLARKAVRFVSYEGKDRAARVAHRHQLDSGYAVGLEQLLSVMNALQPQNEQIGEALREVHPLLPSLAIRELVVNALIHQDMTLTGAGPLIELFSDRIEISNPGKPLIKLDRMVDLPPRSRNEILAQLMRRMNFCEEQGTGLDKVISLVELHQLPAPLLRASEHAMQVVLYAPRQFAQMSAQERIRSCYYHAVLRFLAGDKMKNASLCDRLRIETKNAAQATLLIKKTLAAKLIRVADPEHPRAGYVPYWA